ncbi:MAG: hypothetical protein JWL83_1623 [Actinomycetia bacterium]|nr:hypothetical protein [Actinomycetes bacterium]
MTDARADDARIEELFTGPLDTFVARRDQLARDLRTGGERDAAAAVKQLRRPSRAAWALNQAVRNAPALLDAVVDAGATLLDRQQRALSDGPSTGLREAMRERQRALAALADVAVAALGPNGDAVRDAIERTLQAVSVDPEAAAQVRSGRLAQDLEPPDVFGTLTPGPQAPAPRAPRERLRSTTRSPATPSPATPSPATPSPGPPRAQTSAERRRAAALRGAEQIAAKAREEVAHAERAVEDAQSRAAELARAAQAAADDADRAQQAAAAAARRVDEARERLRAAEESLLEARPPH